jgi:hypothetical protein
MSDASLSICKMYLDKFIYQYLELISFINISVALSVFWVLSDCILLL